MADLQIYSVIYVTFNGALLSEESSVTMNRTSGSNPVATVAKGYAGESPGARTLEMDVTNVVPSSDFELDGGSFMEGLVPCEMGLICAGHSMVAKGFLISDTLKHSVNSETTYDFKFRGHFEQFT